MAQLKSFGERELKRVKLQPSTESDFRTYLIVGCVRATDMNSSHLPLDQQ
jgi:hypothetical protein